MKAKPDYKKLYRKERGKKIKLMQKKELLEDKIKNLESSCSHCAQGDCQ